MLRKSSRAIMDEQTKDATFEGSYGMLKKKKAKQLNADGHYPMFVIYMYSSLPSLSLLLHHQYVFI